MSAFQPYAGTCDVERELYRWSCYATTPIYEVRPIVGALPEPPHGRKWVAKRQHGHSGPQLALLVEDRAIEFSQMLVQMAPRAV